MANELKQVFSASTTTVISRASALTTTSNTTNSEATQLNNSVELYPYALAVLGVPDSLSAAPTAAGQTVDLYMVLDDVDGTTDETPEPGSGDITYRSKYVGSFVFDDTDAAYVKPIVISLEGVKKARFFIYNGLSASLDYSSNPITVKITPFTYAPA